MNYKIYLDDERIPSSNWAKDGTTIVIVRSVEEFKEVFRRMGKPTSISFDHDLGDNVPSGYDAAKWLIEVNCVDTRDMDINVHSANPTGRDNIMGLVKSWEKFLNNQNKEHE